ncbi:MAG TPA: hypothetical protein IAB35_00165 [Candidatus Faecimonas gallistercoris]|nr:hypothetical protein [Candidatus Faecimonas gallistercoris]
MKDKKTLINKINTELKIYINEATFISNSCRNKLIRLLGKEFDISLPLEDFANIDIRLFENGNIEMRGDVYSREEEIPFSEVLERYQRFSEKADALLQRRGKTRFPNNDKNNIKNLFVVVMISIVYIVVIVYAVRSFLHGNFINSLWLLFVFLPWLFPNVRDRFVQAFHYIKRKFRK